MDNPIYAEKVPGRKLTSLRILEEQHFGSLLCHVLRQKEKPLFDHFLANASSAFKSPGAYDAFIYGKKTHRFLSCDVYLVDDFFDEQEVDLDVILILHPLLKRNSRNICDTPTVAQQTVTIKFGDGKGDGGGGKDSKKKDKDRGDRRSTRYPQPNWGAKSPTKRPKRPGDNTGTGGGSNKGPGTDSGSNNKGSGSGSGSNNKGSGSGSGSNENSASGSGSNKNSGSESGSNTNSGSGTGSNNGSGSGSGPNKGSSGSGSNKGGSNKGNRGKGGKGVRGGNKPRPGSGDNRGGSGNGNGGDSNKEDRDGRHVDHGGDAGNAQSFVDNNDKTVDNGDRVLVGGVVAPPSETNDTQTLLPTSPTGPENQVRNISV